MGQIDMELSPPQWWQQFQELTLDLVRHLWPDHLSADIVGREGQSQDGLDIFVHRKDDELIGVQCKRVREMDAGGRLRPGGEFSQDDLVKFVTDAEEYSPPISRFVLATTALPDTSLQQFAISLTQDRAKAKKCGVEIWFWTRFQMEINKSRELLYRHYELVLKSRQDYDPTLHFLTILQTALSRPAFHTPTLNEDSGPDFTQAAKDTLGAFTTGQLWDRVNRSYVIDQAPMKLGRIKDGALKSRLETVKASIELARQRYRRGLADEDLEECNLGVRPLTPQAPTIAIEIDVHKAEAVKSLNLVLREAGLQEIHSRFLEMMERNHANQPDHIHGEGRQQFPEVPVDSLSVR
ncbi:MAG: hypothetical protein ABSE73_13365 [Planctomycetota bacterium]